MKLKFKIDIASGHVHVPVMVNGTGPIDFTFDTGASYTTISKSLAERLGIEIYSGEKKHAHGAGGSPVPIWNAMVSEFSIGDEVSLNMEMKVLDFDSVFKGVGCFTGGVIGHDILKDYRISIDYSTLTLSMQKENGKTVSDGIDWTHFKYIENAHLVGVPVFINGEGPYDLILDTGSSGNVITPKLAETIGLSEELPEGTPSPSGCSGGECVGIGGKAMGYATIVDSLSIGGAVQNNIMLGVIDLQMISPTGKKIDYGIVGYPFLKNYELLLDYPNQRFAFISSNSN